MPSAPPRPASAVLSLGLPPDGRGLALFLAGRRPWAGELEPAHVQEVHAAAQVLLRPVPGVVVPGEDAALAAREHGVAVALAALLCAGELGPALRTLAHEAVARGERLTLLLDLRDERLRALPWELLELLSPAEAHLAPCRVARLADAAGGPLAPRPAARLAVSVACLEPDDRICVRVAADTLALLQGRPAVTAGPAGEPLPDDALRVLHLVAHGRLPAPGQGAVDRVLVALGRERSLDPAAAARWVDPVGLRLDLAVLDVCGAGSQDGTPGSAPAERLVQEGLPAAVAPSLPVDPGASSRFSAALYAALAAGEPLFRAVDAGRRALAALGVPHPSSRWWTPILVVRDASALDLRCAVDAAGPQAWAPQAHSAVHDLLHRARELARVHGFVGVEHLALVLARWDPLPPRLDLARPTLEAVGRRLVEWRAAGGREPALTPRLHALLAGLPAEAGLAEVGDALAGVPWLGLHAGRGGRPEAAETVQPDAAPAAAGQPLAACTLEVLGGPEDGLRLRWDARRPVLGRRDPAGARLDAVELYAAEGAIDPSVSRRHLLLDEAGRVVVRAETHLERGGGAVRLAGAVLLAPGDVLVLGAVTRLLVVELEPRA